VGCNSNRSLGLEASPRSAGPAEPRLRPGVTPVHRAGTGARVPVICWDLGLINLPSSGEVVMVPEEAGEMIVLE